MDIEAQPARRTLRRWGPEDRRCAGVRTPTLRAGSSSAKGFMGLPAVVSVAIVGFCSVALPAQSLAAAPAPAQSRPSVGAFDVRSHTRELPGHIVASKPDVVPEPFISYPSRSAVGMSPVDVRSAPSPMWLHRYQHAFIASHWYGLQVGTDGLLTKKLEAALSDGASISTLAILLGGGPVAVALAAAFRIFGSGLQLCQKSDGWTYSYYVANVIVCNPF